VLHLGPVFPGQFSVKLYTERRVRMFFARLHTRPACSAPRAALVVQLFTSGNVQPMAGLAGPVPEVAAKSRSVAKQEVIRLLPDGRSTALNPKR